MTAKKTGISTLTHKEYLGELAYTNPPKTMKTTKVILFIVAAWICNPMSAQNFSVYRGLLHAHTMFSDGSGTPEEAYKMAKDNKLNFFAVTEHNHAQAEAGAKDRMDGVLIATQHELYNGNSAVAVKWTKKENGTVKTGTMNVKPLIKSAKDAGTSNFVALYGQEFSTISSGNHMNVIGIDRVIEVPNGDFAGLIHLLEQIKGEGKQVPVLQLNHPDFRADIFYNSDKGMFNDYGIDAKDLGPHFKNMVAKIDPYVSLIEVLSGPAMEKKYERNDPDDSHENDYFFYLKQGLHVSPSAGHDNHYKTWGSVTESRMGVWATELSEKALYDAFNNNRTFASEDRNLSVYYKVNDQVMGSSVQMEEEAELKIELKITDDDEPKAVYKVKVYGGDIEQELSTAATKWMEADGLIQEVEIIGNGNFTIKDVRASGKASFVYLKIAQKDGDRLWTAPIWINGPSISMNVEGESAYYWSKSNSSSIYHKKGCSKIKSINNENLMKGETPPAGRVLCKAEEGEEEH
jgi:hypothetical protein